MDAQEESAALLAMLHVFVNEATIRNLLPETVRAARRLMADIGGEPDFEAVAKYRAA